MISLFIFFASGTRYPVIVGAGAFLASRHLRQTGKLPRLRHLPPILLAAFLTLGWIGAARSQTAFGLDRSQTEAATSSSQIFVPQAALHDFVERNGYELGSTYTYALVQVVPRAIWDGKPSNPIEAVVDDLYPGSGIAFPIWGEWYLNFGWIGVVVLGFGFGFAISSLWLGWIVRRRSPSMDDPIAVLASLLLINAVSRGYFVQALYIYGAFLFLPLVLSRRSNHREETDQQGPPARESARTVQLEPATRGASRRR